MASVINGLDTVIGWSSFRTITEDEPEDESEAAYTAATFRFSTIPVSQVVGVTPAVYRIQDGLVVNVRMNPYPDPANNSWKTSWMMAWPEDRKAALLTHERGHYKITGLVGRDCMNAIRAIRTQDFNSVQDAITEAQSIISEYNTLSSTINTLYDTDNQTRHGMRADIQATWNGYLSTAQTQGTSLRSILQSAGHTV